MNKVDFNLIPFSKVDQSKIKGSLEIVDNHVCLSFFLKEMLNKCEFPVFKKIRRKDKLWESTVFECFISSIDEGQNYWEYNFSPCGAWNCYYFRNYRSPLNWYSQIPPRINFQNEGIFAIEFQLNQEQIKISSLKIGLSCILINKIEEPNYWALNHPRKKPDFHDPLGHTLLLNRR